MKAGSAFASFLSRGATLILPDGAPLAASRAAVAAAVLGVAFASSAHAQTAHHHRGTAESPRIVAPAATPPYATAGKHTMRTAPTSSAQQTRPHQQRRMSGNTFTSAPFALGAAMGVTVVQPVVVPVQPYGQVGYGVQPEYGPASVPSLESGSMDDGYRAENIAPQRFVAGRAQPVPEHGRMRDPESARGTIVFAGERLNARDVMATVAAARIAGVAPAALLALQSRSLEAVEMAKQSAGDNPNAPISGPYAFSVDRWSSAVSRFGAAVGIGGAVQGITGGAVGDEAVDRSAVNALRDDPYVAGLMAAAEMAANDAAYRQTFGDGPNMAELVVGHHAGRQAMIRLSQVYRRAPDARLDAVVKPNFARDLVVLTGLSHVPPPQGGWTVGTMIRTIDNALKNSLTRYAEADRMKLPPDYKPEVRAYAGTPQAVDGEYRGPRPGF